jgi:lysophospholipase L1-like esterase
MHERDAGLPPRGTDRPWHIARKAYLAILISLLTATDYLPVRSHNGHDASHLVERTAPIGHPLRIMPLGASMTAGRDSTTGNGYRKDLLDKLEADGNNVTYVGTQFYGTMADNVCEAYPGYTIERVDNATRQSGALLFLPNVILVNLGTNDCALKNKDPSGAPERYRELLDHVKVVVPNALVIVSSLIHNLDAATDACIVTLNAGLEQVASDVRSLGQKVAFVDMYDAVPTDDISKLCLGLR